MKTFTLLALMGSVALASSAMAVTPAKDDASAKAIKPATMTCEDFLALDDSIRPEVIYWVDGINRKGKPEDAQIDVERTNRLVPVLIEDCGKAPQASFWQKAKEDFKKVL